MKWTFNGRKVRFIESTQAGVLYLVFSYLLVGGLMLLGAMYH
jgi:hypothetical protein